MYKIKKRRVLKTREGGLLDGFEHMSRALLVRPLNLEANSTSTSRAMVSTGIYKKYQMYCPALCEILCGGLLSKTG